MPMRGLSMDFQLTVPALLERAGGRYFWRCRNRYTAAGPVPCPLHLGQCLPALAAARKRARSALALNVAATVWPR